MESEILYFSIFLYAAIAIALWIGITVENDFGSRRCQSAVEILATAIFWPVLVSIAGAKLVVETVAGRR